MGVEVRPLAVRSDLERQNIACRALQENIRPAIQRIERYAGDQRLSGQAFEAHKNYMRRGHVPALNAFIVLNREEAESQEWPDDTVVAWPDPELGQGYANGFNLIALNAGLSLENFGLSYPVTIDDLATNWEGIYDFRRHIRGSGLFSDNVSLSTAAERFGAEANLAELEIFRTVDDPNTFNQILERAAWMGFSWESRREPILDLLIAAGSVDAFFDITDRILDGELTLEEAMTELEAGGD